MINNEDFELWEISWVHDKIKKIFRENPIVDRIIIDDMTETPTPDEIKTFLVLLVYITMCKMGLSLSWYEK